MKILLAFVIFVSVLLHMNAINAGHSTKHHTPMQKFVHAVNEERADLGLNLLTPRKSLNRGAERWADELCHSRSLRHAELDVNAPWRIMGENIGRQGGGSVNSLIRAFRNSPSHYQNMIRSDYTHMGFGQCKDNTGERWVVYRFAG
mgnify:CR=1 FL=1